MWELILEGHQYVLRFPMGREILVIDVLEESLTQVSLNMSDFNYNY